MSSSNSTYCDINGLRVHVHHHHHQPHFPSEARGTELNITFDHQPSAISICISKHQGGAPESRHARAGTASGGVGDGGCDGGGDGDGVDGDG